MNDTLDRGGEADENNSVLPSGLDKTEVLRRRIEVQRQLLRIAKTNGIALYRPHWYQHQFHTSPAKRRGAFAGNRGGKSQSNGAETAAWMLGERPWYKVPFDVLGVEHNGTVASRKVVVKYRHPGGEDHPFVRQGIPPYPTKQLVICTNWKKVEEVWTAQDSDRPGKLWQFLPKGWAKGYTNHEGVIAEVYGKNGSYLCFMSAEQYKRNKLAAESADWDRVSFDEPGPEGLWKGTSRGLVDRNGQGDFTLTSLEEMWIYDRFTGENATEATFSPLDRFHVLFTMLDNPHLSNEAITRFMADLTEDERQCRIFGLPLELSGLVYKEFRRDVHVLRSLPEPYLEEVSGGTPIIREWTDYHLPPKNHILYIRIDTHPVTPHAVSFFAVGPDDLPIQCHEIWQNCDADRLAELINAYITLTGCWVGNIRVEPAAWIKDQNRPVSIAQTLARHGLFISRASKDMEGGISATRSALRRNRILFSPHVTHTLREIQRYRFDVETGKPVDEHDHFMENLRRFLIDRCPYFSPDKAAGQAVPDESFESADLSPVL